MKGGGVGPSWLTSLYKGQLNVQFMSLGGDWGWGGGLGHGSIGGVESGGGLRKGKINMKRKPRKLYMIH